MTTQTLPTSCPYCDRRPDTPGQEHYWRQHPHSGKWFCGGDKCEARGHRDRRGAEVPHISTRQLKRDAAEFAKRSDFNSPFAHEMSKQGGKATITNTYGVSVTATG